MTHLILLGPIVDLLFRFGCWSLVFMYSDGWNEIAVIDPLKTPDKIEFLRYHLIGFTKVNDGHAILKLWDGKKFVFFDNLFNNEANYKLKQISIIFYEIYIEKI
jgi:hypothetical protein